jgi:hypothetical protein
LYYVALYYQGETLDALFERMMDMVWPHSIECQPDHEMPPYHALTALIQYSTPATNEVVVGILGKLVPLLSDRAYFPAATAIWSAVKAVAIKLRGDMPHCPELVQCMRNQLAADMNGEEPLEVSPALLLCGGQDQLQHFGMAIHRYAIEATESDKPTLPAIGYCVLGDVVVALPVAIWRLAESIEKVLAKCEFVSSAPTIPIVKAISLIMRGAATAITTGIRERVVGLFARMVDPGRFGQGFEEELATAANLIRAFANIVIGYRQNQAFLMEVAKLAFNFVQTIWNIKSKQTRRRIELGGGRTFLPPGRPGD